MEAYLEDNRSTIDEVCEKYEVCAEECPVYEFCHSKAKRESQESEAQNADSN